MSHTVLNDENADDGNGLRRGKRTRYAPLEWWRLEKVVYGRRDSGTTFVPNIKEIRRLPKEEPRPLGAKHRKRRPPQSKSKSQTAEVDAEGQLVFNPEEGWDAETDSKGCVMDYDKDEEIEKREFCSSVRRARLLINGRLDRGGVHREDADAESGRKQRLLLPEDLRGWRFHRGWTAYHTAQQAEAHQGYQGQYVCKSPFSSSFDRA